MYSRYYNSNITNTKIINEIFYIENSFLKHYSKFSMYFVTSAFQHLGLNFKIPSVKEPFMASLYHIGQHSSRRHFVLPLGIHIWVWSNVESFPFCPIWWSIIPSYINWKEHLSLMFCRDIFVKTKVPMWVCLLLILVINAYLLSIFNFSYKLHHAGWWDKKEQALTFQSVESEFLPVWIVTFWKRILF